MDQNYTAEELLLDESFVDFCLNDHSVHKMKWEKARVDNPQLTIPMQEARELLNLLSPQLSQAEINGEVNKLRETIDGRQSNLIDRQSAKSFIIEEEQLPKRKSKKRLVGYSIAATSVALIGLFIYNRQETGKITAPSIAAEFHTGTGERKKLTLADGSEIILNSNSTVSIDESFNHDQRSVQLTGQAFFKVAKNAYIPFIVHTGGFSTTALGTAFYVDGRTDGYAVKLLEGKVRLESASKENTQLYPGQSTEWNSSSKHFQNTIFDTHSLNQWVSGKISFDKTPATTAFTTLEQWFGITIEDKRAHPSKVFVNGDYTNQSLEDILKVICFALSCQYSKNDQKIIIH